MWGVSGCSKGGSPKFWKTFDVLSDCPALYIIPVGFSSKSDSPLFPKTRRFFCKIVCVCVRNPESKGKAGGPWTHRWHGPMKTHLCRRENIPANSFCQKWQGGQAKKPPMPTCHDMTWHANVTTWHDMYHFISFHPLSSGVYQVCLSCTRISGKVPGKLGGASTGDTRLQE